MASEPPVVCTVTNPEGRDLKISEHLPGRARELHYGSFTEILSLVCRA